MEVEGERDGRLNFSSCLSSRSMVARPAPLPRKFALLLFPSPSSLSKIKDPPSAVSSLMDFGVQARIARCSRDRIQWLKQEQIAQGPPHLCDCMLTDRIWAQTLILSPCLDEASESVRHRVGRNRGRISTMHLKMIERRASEWRRPPAPPGRTEERWRG